jgi:hypothetical protein
MSARALLLSRGADGVVREGASRRPVTRRLVDDTEYGLTDTLKQYRYVHGGAATGGSYYARGLCRLRII